MKPYLIKVRWYQPYPKESDYRIEASSVHTAAARGLREWKKEIGRKRFDNLRVEITRL
jgi:hypothetical protein